jgi:hypothetical protein
VIDAGESGEDFGAVGFRVDGASRTFQRPHGGVAIHRHEQRIAERTRFLKITHVADMEQVEDAIRKDELPTSGAMLVADLAEGFDSWELHRGKSIEAALRMPIC